MATNAQTALLAAAQMGNLPALHIVERAAEFKAWLDGSDRVDNPPPPPGPLDALADQAETVKAYLDTSAPQPELSRVDKTLIQAKGAEEAIRFYESMLGPLPPREADAWRAYEASLAPDEVSMAPPEVEVEIKRGTVIHLAGGRRAQVLALSYQLDASRTAMVRLDCVECTPWDER